MSTDDGFKAPVGALTVATADDIYACEDCGFKAPVGALTVATLEAAMYENDMKPVSKRLLVR